eukprot:365380-Chlamydomonas_euryale.AAC.8
MNVGRKVWRGVACSTSVLTPSNHGTGQCGAEVWDARCGRGGVRSQHAWAMPLRALRGECGPCTSAAPCVCGRRACNATGTTRCTFHTFTQHPHYLGRRSCAACWRGKGMRCCCMHDTPTLPGMPSSRHVALV